MAEKLNITRAQVLTAVLEGDWDTLQTADARKCTERMLASMTRKAVPAGPSKASQENEALAHEVLAVLTSEPMLTSEIMARVGGIRTSQKCAKVMQVLLDSGAVVRVPKTKGRYIGYRLA